MTAAANLGSLHECLDGLIDVSLRLTRDFGLTLEWQPLGERAGFYEWANRKFVVNIDSPLDDQLWTLIQAWSYLAIGPHATPNAHPTRALRLITGS